MEPLDAPLTQDGLAAVDTGIRILGNCRLDTPIAPLLGEKALHCVGGADRIAVDHRLSALLSSSLSSGEVPVFRQVEPLGYVWMSVLEATGQPALIC